MHEEPPHRDFRALVVERREVLDQWVSCGVKATSLWNRSALRDTQKQQHCRVLRPHENYR